MASTRCSASNLGRHARRLDTGQRAESVLGMCHGFQVVSGHEFVYLRDGESGESLRVSSTPTGIEAPEGVPLVEIKRRDETLTRVYQDGPLFQVWMEGVGRFEVDPAAPAITFPEFSHPTWLEGITWGLPTALVILGRGGLVLHASAVEVGGRAVLFAAPGGHGKTTLAATMAARGHRLLSEDLIRCAVGDPVVFPGPAMLKLRHDVAGWLELPGSQVASDPQKIHLALSAQSRGSGEAVPLAAVFFLHQAVEISLDRRDPVPALNDLWSISLNIPNTPGRAACFQQIADLASVVPIFDLRRPLTADTLDAVVERVLDVCAAV
jgi:hypothetical protein